MILGIGTDLVDIRRIEATLKRFGDRFTERCFTEVERTRARRRPNPAAFYARRFAAKEACAKALGTGFRRGVFWRDLGVVSRPGGQPSMALRGGAALRLGQLLPAGMCPRIDLTMADEPPWAQAFVILSAMPAGPPAGGA